LRNISTHVSGVLIRVHLIREIVRLPEKDLFMCPKTNTSMGVGERAGKLHAILDSNIKGGLCGAHMIIVMILVKPIGSVVQKK